MYYEHLFKLFEEKSNNFLSISPDSSQITYVIVDNSNRSHVFQLNISTNYPTEPPKLSYDLPAESIVPITGNLLTYIKWFDDCVAKYQNLWDQLFLIDNTFIVSDPKKPFFSHVHRRILLNNSCSIHITFNPLHPQRLPKYKYVGPERSLETLRSDFKIEKWDANLSAADNILILLKDYIKYKSEEDLIETEIECSICYGDMADELNPIYCNVVFLFSILV